MRTIASGMDGRRWRLAVELRVSFGMGGRVVTVRQAGSVTWGRSEEAS